MPFFNRLKDAALYWSRNNAGRLSAALTYYALASLAPMMVLLLSIAGLFFNPERAAAVLTGPVSVAIGADFARTIRGIFENAYNPGGNITAGAFSILITIVTGSELFRQLGFSLNEFLHYKQPSEDLPFAEMAAQVVVRYILNRLRAFLIVLGAGLLLLAGMLSSTLLSAGRRYLSNFVEFPFGLAAWGSRLFTLVFVSLLFALIYRFATRRDLSWGAVLQGGLAGGLIFTVLQEFLGAFLVSNRLTTTYGAAASIVVLLFWLYYSIQVMFFGAAWARTVSTGETSA